MGGPPAPPRPAAWQHRHRLPPGRRWGAGARGNWAAGSQAAPQRPPEPRPPPQAHRSVGQGRVRRAAQGRGGRAGFSSRAGPHTDQLAPLHRGSRLAWAGERFPPQLGAGEVALGWARRRLRGRHASLTGSSPRRPSAVVCRRTRPGSRGPGSSQAAEAAAEMGNWGRGQGQLPHEAGLTGSRGGDGEVGLGAAALAPRGKEQRQRLYPIMRSRSLRALMSAQGRQE